MKKCNSSYNPDYLSYEDPQEKRERIKDLEREANESVDYVGEFLTQNYPYEKFTGSFDEDVFWEKFYSIDGDDEKKVRSQVKAIRYALWFARKGDNRAKNIIISVMNKKVPALSEDVMAEAQTAFYLFISSYVRTEIEKKYHEKQILFENSTQLKDAIREAMGYAWESILEALPRFDESRGAITTFVREPIKEGFYVAEAKRNQKTSKQLLSIDGRIVKAKQAIEEKGIEATPRLIELELNAGKKPNQKTVGVQQIIASGERARGESSCFSADGDSNEALYFNKEAAQTRFLTPEEALETEEKNKKIINIIMSLDEVPRYVLLASSGFEVTEDGIFEAETKSMSQLAEELELSGDEVFKKKNIAIDQFRQRFLDDGDSLLKGKELEFDDSAKDDEINDFLASIITITDDDFINFEEETK